MSKRKPSQDEESDSDVSLVNVDFEFFDPNPAVDYHALKRLLTQLFESDAELFHLHELVELILSQPTIGTTIKTEGIESDPYALLTVINMNVHQNHPSIKALAGYALEKTKSDAEFHAVLESLLGAENGEHVGLVLSERLVNMPMQVVPPMYRMLADELKWAIDDKEPYRFGQLLFMSRTYRVASEETGERLPKRARVEGDPVQSFHGEDSSIMEVASHVVTYRFRVERDGSGVDTGGRMMLVEGMQLGSLVTLLGERWKPISTG